MVRPGSYMVDGMHDSSLLKMFYLLDDEDGTSSTTDGSYNSFLEEEIDVLDPNVTRSCIESVYFCTKNGTIVSSPLSGSCEVLPT